MSNPKLLTNFFKAVMSQEKKFVVDLINKIDDETEEILKRLSPHDRNTVRTLYIVRNWSTQLDLLDMLNPNVDMKKIEHLFNLVMNRYLHAKELELGKPFDTSSFKRPTSEEEERRRIAEEERRRIAEEERGRIAEEAVRRAAEIEEASRLEAARLEAARLAAVEAARLAAVEAARLEREASDREAAEAAKIAAREADRLKREAEQTRLAAEAEQAKLAKAEADRKAAEQAELNRRLQEEARRREQEAAAEEARRAAREQADAVAKAGVEQRKAAFNATVNALFGKLQEQMNLVSGLTPETINSVDELKALSPIIDEAARQLGLAEASFQQIRGDYPELVDEKNFTQDGKSFNEVLSGANPAFRKLIKEKRILIKERNYSLNQQEAVAKVRREAEEARTRRVAKEAEIAQLKSQLAQLQAMGITNSDLETAKQKAEAELNRLKEEHRSKATKAGTAENELRRSQEALAAQIEFVRQVQEKAQKKLAEVNILRDRVTVFAEPKLSLTGKDSKFIKVGYEAGELKRAGGILKGYIYGYMKDQLQQLRDDILDLFNRIKLGTEQPKDATIKQQLIDALTKDTTGSFYQDLTEVKKGAVPNRFWKDFNTVKIEYGYEKNQTVHTDFDTFLNRFITFAESVNRQNLVIHFPTKSEGEYKWLINPTLIGEIKSRGNKYFKMTFDGKKTETQFWRLDKLDIQEGGGESYEFKFEFVVEYSAEGKEFTGVKEEAQGVLDTLVQAVKDVIRAGIRPVLGAAPAQQLDEDSEREIAEAKAREEGARREADARRLAKEQADREEQDSDRAEKEAAARAREADDKAAAETGRLGSDRDRQLAELSARLAAAESANIGLVDADVDALATVGLTPPAPSSRQSTPSVVGNVLGALGLDLTPTPSPKTSIPLAPARPTGTGRLETGTLKTGRLPIFQELAPSPASTPRSPFSFESDSLAGSSKGTPSSRQSTPSSRQSTPEAVRLFRESDARLNAALNGILGTSVPAQPPSNAGLAAGAVAFQKTPSPSAASPAEEIERKLSAEYSPLFDKVNEFRVELVFLLGELKEGKQKELIEEYLNGKKYNELQRLLSEFRDKVVSYPKLFEEINGEILALQNAYTDLDDAYNAPESLAPPVGKKAGEDLVEDRLVGGSVTKSHKLNSKNSGGIGNVHREKYLKYKQKYHSLKRKHNM